MTFDEVHELAMVEEATHTPTSGFGYQTAHFVRMFAKDPQRTLAALNDAYVDCGQWRDDFPAITFLSARHLNQDLHAYLLSHGFPAHALAFLLAMPRENVSPPSAARWTGELVARVAHDERLLFRMLADLGFTFSSPGVACSQEGLPPKRG